MESFSPSNGGPGKVWKVCSVRVESVECKGG